MVDYNTLLTTALADRIENYKKATIDTKALADALGAMPQDSGIFGTLNTGDLLGMGPEGVESLAKARSSIGYEKMMTDLGGLEFAQKATGQPARDTLTNALISGQQQIAGDIAKTKEAGRASAKQDPIRTMIAGFIQGLPPERKSVALTKMSEEFMSGSRIKPTDAVQILADRGGYLRAVATGQDEATASLLYPMGTDPTLSKAATDILGIKGMDLGEGEGDAKKAAWMEKAKKANPKAKPEQLEALWKRKQSTSKTGD